MRAMVLEGQKKPLVLRDVPLPKGPHIIKVLACGVCRTDLHIVDGDLKAPHLPLIPGHEIVGILDGQRVGVPWLAGSCGHCPYCQTARENLCDAAHFTGYTVNGGYAEYASVNPDYCFPIPDSYNNEEAAPLLCAGLIGFRALRKCGQAKTIGFYGFGASAHITIQAATYLGKKIFAFTKEGDGKGQDFARSLGAAWAGSSRQPPPQPLDAAIIFAPVGSLVIEALSHLRKGGIVVLAGIHMSDIPPIPYPLIWGERCIASVANLTREDGRLFFDLAQKAKIKTTVASYPLERANEALQAVRSGTLTGAAVLSIAQR